LPKKYSRWEKKKKLDPGWNTRPSPLDRLGTLTRRSCS
jgi:hypothetical protein